MQITNKLIPLIKGSALKVGIAVAQFNEDVTLQLLASARYELARAGVLDENITVYQVPGCAELPFTLQKLALTQKYNCLVALGCIIRGETPHFEYICKMAQEGVLRITLDEKIPVGFGIITVNTPEQAHARYHLGAEATRAAMQLALL